MPSPDIGVGTLLSVYVSGITATAQENPPSDDLPINKRLDCDSARRGFRRRAVRNDDGARPPQGSPRSDRPLVLAPGVILVCPSASPDVCDSDDTTQQSNTHIRDVREICYGWHPWHGRRVQVRASLVKRGRPVAYCSLEDVPTCRVLEVPLWMLDVVTCCQTRLSQPGLASVQSLRELKEVLQSAQARVRDHTAPPETQHRYLLEAGGAMVISLVPRRSSQLPLLARPQNNPHWTDLSSEAQRKIVRLLAQVLRQHREKRAEAELAKEAQSE